MEIIWNSLLIAAAVCLVLFLLATAVSAVFSKWFWYGRNIPATR
ncbi:MAG: hypothetical protein ACLSF7_00335 [Acutalibacteraceae bacterium]